jgi:hypothetical protein
LDPDFGVIFRRTLPQSQLQHQLKALYLDNPKK